MFKSNLKIAWRSLIKDRQFTLLNLLGLSTGLACSLMIYLWVIDELQFDKFQPNSSQVYQAMINSKSSNGIETIPQTSALLADALVKDYPEIEAATASVPVAWGAKTTLSFKDNITKTTGLYVSKDYLKVFPWHLVEGNSNQALAARSAIVISKALAIKLFNTVDNVIGKTIEWQHDKTFSVSGVFEGTPPNSSIQFDFLLSMDVFLDANPFERDWGNSDPNTYVLLKKGTKVGAFNKKIAGFMKSKTTGSTATMFFRPFSQAYLYGKYENGMQAGGRIEYVRLFSIIALFILMIACINFMNLSTAKSSQRMKEVGIKKCVGASRTELIFQYLGESLVMSILSTAIAIVLVALLLPSFNDITGKQLSLRFDLSIIVPLLAIMVLTGLISGSYPAFYLSAFRPVAILKGKIKTSFSELWIRRGLVVFQFTLSAIFIISVLVVYKQIAFIQSKNNGFDKDNIVSFDMEGKASAPEDQRIYLAGVANLLAAVKVIPGVVNASSMDHESIIADYGTTSDFEWEGKDPKTVISFGNIGFNYGMIETLGMKMAAGRSFSKTLSSDSSEIIFNEAAIDMMGLKNPVGKTIKMWGKDRTIAGVVQNFNFESLHQTIKPFAIRLEPLYTYNIMAKIKAGNETQVLEQIRILQHKYCPGFVFDYKFLDQDYQAQYVAEKRVATLSQYFAGLAILISCLGLFGLAAFTAQRRQKEIGIRKIVGASVSGVVYLLSIDFLKWIGLSLIIAFPLSWWIMSSWLNGFAYRVGLGVDIFLLAGIVTLVVTLGTISYQSIKAALANPVKSLRSE